MPRTLSSGGLLLVSTMLAACAGGEPYEGPFPGGETYAQFQASVYPVLMRDCAFPECHGGPQRFLQLYGPGRVRLDPLSKSTDPATEAEVRLSYTRALSMLVTDADLARSLLLTKPLEAAAGGQGHKGFDQLGRNVYGSTGDPGYAAIAAWAQLAIATTEAGPAAGGRP